jgi:hypothetical protein
MCVGTAGLARARKTAGLNDAASLAVAEDSGLRLILHAKQASPSKASAAPYGVIIAGNAEVQHRKRRRVCPTAPADCRHRSWAQPQYTRWWHGIRPRLLT